MIVAFVTLAALAQLYGEVSRDEAPPRWGVEFRAGPFDPKIGSTVERDYYELVYASGGDDSWFKYKPLLKTFEVSWYPVRDIGLLGLSFRVGHWRTQAPTRVCEDSAGDQVACTPNTVDDSEAGN